MSWALGGLIFLGCLAGSTLLGDLISEEIRGWLDLAPRGLLRLAATQLDPMQRETIYQDEWLPELTYILRGAESRPITRLIRGMAFATGIVISARRIAQRLDRGQAGPPASPSMSAPIPDYTFRVSEVLRMLEQHPGLRLPPPVYDEATDFYWVPDVTADGSRGAIVGQVRQWRGRPMKWPPPDQSG